MEMRLRRACGADMDLLYRWANEPIVRQNAFHTEPIPYTDHVQWFSEMMADDAVRQYILCDGDLPVGQIRLNLEGAAALIDYSVAAQERGKGYGRTLLRLAQEELEKDETLRAAQLVGLVKHGNTASAKTFEKCGYQKEAEREYNRYVKKIGRRQ